MGALIKALEHASFPELAVRVCALYNDAEDALLLGMLGQEYVIKRSGIFLYGQKAPDNHAAVVSDYLLSSGNALTMLPWRSFGDFAGRPAPEFRGEIEIPLAQYAGGIIARAGTVLPHMDATLDRSIIASDMSITVRALPKVYLHVDLSQDAQEFPAEVWVQFSNNADDFLSLSGMRALGELFKERVLSLLRIY